MTTSSTCAQCGVALADGQLHGRCPGCLWSDLFAAEQEAHPQEARLSLDVPGHHLLEELARGGMGIVYRARETESGREVALKMLLPFQAVSPTMRERFRLEARAAAALDHPNILPLHHVGESQEMLFFTMKLARGGTLASRRGEFSGRWREIAELMAKLADAIHFAHARGILHRDLKPGNILFDDAGAPYVADFGLAKLSQPDSASELPSIAELTRSQSVLGTPHYLAPEVAERGAGQATVASDVYGLGAMLYELLTGQVPFSGESPTQLLAAIAGAPPRAPRSRNAAIPRDLETICLHCLAKDPGRRYASAGDLAEDLRHWQVGLPIRARPVSWPERLWLWARRNPWPATAATIFLAAGGVAVVQTMSALRRGQEAKAANARAEEELWNSRLVQARALRQSGQQGSRAQALEAIAAAARHRPSKALQDEAIATLATSDLGAVLAETEKLSETGWARFDSDLEYALGYADPAQAAYRLVRLSDQQIVQEFPLSVLGRRQGEWMVNAALSADVQEALLLTNAGRLMLWTIGQEKPRWIVRTEQKSPAANVIGWLSGQPYCLDPRGLHVFDRAGQACATTPEPPLDLNAALAIAPEAGLAALRGQEAHKVYVVTWPGLRRTGSSFAFDHTVYGVALSADGQMLAAGLENGGTMVVDVPSRRERALPTQDGPVSEVAFSPDKQWLSTCYWGGITRVWDPGSLRLLFELPMGVPRAFTKGGEKVALVTEANLVRVHSLERSEVLTQLRDDNVATINAVGLSPDQRWMVLGGEAGASVWDLRQRRLIRSTAGGRVRGVDFSQDGQQCFLAGELGLFRYPVRIVDGQPAEVPPEALIAQPTMKIISAARSGERWALIDAGRSRVITPGRPESTVLLPQAPEASYACAFSPDGHWVATATFKGAGVFVHDAKTGKVVKRLAKENANLAFSPDSRILAVSSETAFALWDTATWTPRLEQPAIHSSGGGRLAYSPDGRLLAYARDKRIISLLEAKTMQEIAQLRPPSPRVLNTLDFSQDGALLFAATQGNDIQVWDLAKLQARLREMGLAWE